MPYTIEQQKENRKKWVEALRSGEYEQGTRFLKDGETYCCLGVLQKLFGKNYFGNRCSPTKSVMDAVGLTSSLGDHSGKECLALQNDNGATFPEIADIIESEPSGLFTS